MRKRYALLLCPVALFAACTSSGSFDRAAVAVPAPSISPPATVVEVPSTTLGAESPVPESLPRESPAPGTLAIEVTAARAAHTATSLADGSILVAGGCVVDGCSTATAAMYLVAADGGSAIEVASLSIARDVHTSTLLPDGRVVLVGGFAGEGQPPTATIDVFDPARRATTASAEPMMIARGGHAVAMADSKLLGRSLRST